MATAIATATPAVAAHISAEEALLDAYDLQWKAIDIRLERLRNECERMILEYEVEIKQQMYLRESEDLMRQKEAQHAAERIRLQHELTDKDRQLEDAKADADEQRTIVEEKQATEVQLKKKLIEELKQKAIAEEEKRKVEKQLADELKARKEEDNQKVKPGEKRKTHDRDDESHDRHDDEAIGVAVPVVKEKKKVTAPKTKAKRAAKAGQNSVKKTTKDPKLNPTGPKEASKKSDELAAPLSAIFPGDEEPCDLDAGLATADLSSVVDQDLLQMLSQDQDDYESEDFGNTSSISLIHPQSPAVSTQKQKKAMTKESSDPTNNNNQPLTLQDRIRNRIKSISREPLGEPEPHSDDSPAPILQSPPPKRALKRRKMSPAVSPSDAALSARSAILKRANSDNVPSVDSNASSQEKDSASGAVGIVTKKKKSTMTASPTPNMTTPGATVTDDTSANTTTHVLPTEVPSSETTKSKPTEEEGPTTNSSQTAKRNGLPSSKTDKNGETGVESAMPNPASGKSVSKAKEDVTKRTKARKSAKMAALKAAAEEEARHLTGFTAIHDIATPKVPRKKMGIDGKKKQINDLAARRAEFQQIMSETAGDSAADTANVAGAMDDQLGKKRRRDTENKEAGIDLFQTPKPKLKKRRASKNHFANDELNIMKSPVPLLRAKIALKKKQESEEKKTKKKKRSVSDRGGIDEEEPDYGSPAEVVISTNSSTHASTHLSTSLLTKSGATTSSDPTAPKSADPLSTASDYASRWLNSGLVTRAKKNAVKAARKPTSKSPKPASLWGAGPSFFDAFVNTTAPSIPRLKTSSSVPKE